ncbi:unnamed protein product [Linum trigynum]|uniref:Uncharacterized protein n=1 Tax=Linum trigynum TaxID=586398 RepID=A0AAV2FZS1_9ROSI
MAPSDLTQHFAPILQLGSVYLFQDVTSSSPDFWVDAFEFSPFSSLQSHIRASVYLTDVVGVSITCVSSTVTSFGSTVRSDLVLQNENLWGGIARTLNGQDLVVLGHSDPILLVVCSLWVTSATRGGYSLTSTPDTRYVLNPVSEMSHLVQSVFFSSTNTVHYYPPRFATPHEEAAFEAECTKTVSQLLALCFPPVADGYYLGYALCSKAAIDYDGVDKWCDDHHFLVPQQAQNFYKLRATVDDTTGSAVFVLLGRAADLLVGLTAHDLSARFPHQRNSLPQ